MENTLKKEYKDNQVKVIVLAFAFALFVMPIIQEMFYSFSGKNTLWTGSEYISSTYLLLPAFFLLCCLLNYMNKQAKIIGELAGKDLNLWKLFTQQPN